MLHAKYWPIADIMVFAGVDPAHAGEVVREGTRELQVPLQPGPCACRSG